MRLVIGDRILEVRPGKDTFSLDGRIVPYRALYRDGVLEAVEVEGVSIPVRVARDGERALVWCEGSVFEARQAGREARPAEHAGSLISPMPGRVRRALVAAGDSVTRGQVLMVLEAMKMEHAIRSPKDGVVLRIMHGEGELVDAGVALAEIT